MKSLKRLSIDPLAVYGTLCVKCPVPDPSLADPACVARLVEELAIVQPKIVVVMGEEALAVLNELDIPLARPLEPEPGEIQRLTPSIEALYVPNIDEALDERGGQARLLARVPRARRLVRGAAAVLVGPVVLARVGQDLGRVDLAQRGAAGLEHRALLVGGELGAALLAPVAGGLERSLLQVHVRSLVDEQHDLAHLPPAAKRS